MRGIIMVKPNNTIVKAINLKYLQIKEKNAPMGEELNQEVYKMETETDDIKER